jgi:4-alpha-glucanotransferase
MNNGLLQSMLEYKNITVELISSLESENYDALDLLLDKRQAIIEELKIVEYTDKEFYSIYNQLQMEEHQNKLENLFKTKMSIVKDELKKIKLSKNANQSYNHREYSDSIYFNKEGNFDSLGAYQSPASPYASWYKFKHWPDEYECWWDVVTMPNVNEMDPGYLDFQLLSPDSTVRKWMRMGIDGWRLDVADELPDSFIQKLKSVVRQENSDAMLLGEEWEDASNKISYEQRRGYLSGSELDSVTNYPLRSALVGFILGKDSAQHLLRLMMSLKENYPKAQFYALMNMTGTHDTPRLMTVMGDAPDASSMSEEEKGNFRLSPSQYALAKARVMLYAAVLFTYPGVPTVYYGDEAGMQGYADPYNRGPYPWGKEDEQLQAFFMQLSCLRRQSDALCNGSYEPFLVNEDVYGHFRWNDQECYMVLINRSGVVQSVHRATQDQRCGQAIDMHKEKDEISIPNGGILECKIDPYQAKILKIVKSDETIIRLNPIGI